MVPGAAARASNTPSWHAVKKVCEAQNPVAISSNRFNAATLSSVLSVVILPCRQPVVGSDSHGRTRRAGSIPRRCMSMTSNSYATQIRFALHRAPCKAAKGMCKSGQLQRAAIAMGHAPEPNVFGALLRHYRLGARLTQETLAVRA